MKTQENIIEQIRGYIDVSEIIPVTRGYSFDEKYLCITGTGEKYLFRVTKSDDARVLTSRREQFNLIRQLGDYSDLVPKAYYFWFSEDHRSCQMILEFFDGEDGEHSLKTLSEEVQYDIGYSAGVELRKLHKLSAPREYSSWSFLKWRKYKWYCNEYNKNSLVPEGVDLEIVDTFIKKHKSFMDDISPTFQHDDFHPANLIIENGRLNGIIDFNRCDFGDPIHDFVPSAHFTRNISIPFAQGQIDGYFNGQVPMDFWKRYSLYCAMSIIPNIVWSVRYDIQTGSHQEIEKAFIRIRTIYDDHDGFSSMIPGWYKE